MDYAEYQIELLDYLKCKFIEANKIINSKYVFLGDQESKYTKYYVRDYTENLISRFPANILEKFEKGSGKELVRSKDCKTPPKMASIRSSSALFYNVFESIDYSKFRWLNHQIYNFTVEEQLIAFTTNANLDGYLEAEETIIFVESKFAESYFGKGGTLSTSYLMASTNINSDWQDFFKQFLVQDEFGKPIIFKRKIDKNGKIKCFYKSIFIRYDGLQMLKHLLGIYKDIKTNITRYKAIKEVVLVNLVWNINGLNKSLDNINNEVYNDLTKTNVLFKMREFMQNEIIKLGLDIKFSLEYLNYQEFIRNHENEFKLDRYSYLKERYLI